MNGVQGNYSGIHSSSVMATPSLGEGFRATDATPFSTIEERVTRGDGNQSFAQNVHQPLSENTFNRTLDRVKKALQEHQERVQLDWNKDTRQVVMKIRDRDTGELIQQIPPQNVIDREIEFTRLIGVLFDQKV
jgi:flagellar protein FlaG